MGALNKDVKFLEITPFATIRAVKTDKGQRLKTVSLDIVPVLPGNEPKDKFYIQGNLLRGFSFLGDAQSKIVGDQFYGDKIIKKALLGVDGRPL